MIQPSELERIFKLQKERQPEIRATSARERIAKLRKLGDAILAQRAELEKALMADLQKPTAEAAIGELFPTLSEIKHASRHLHRWMEPVHVGNPRTYLGSSGKYVYEPKGVVLIIAPWNFPFQLTVGPLISAIAAGNCAMVKPSELSPHTSGFIARLLSSLFPEHEVAVIEGDPEVATSLLQLPFDHIFFTGSTTVGKIVMQAAAKNLASVTLELGGKSPVVIDSEYDASDAARKILWGKSFNAGQTCVAPDYLLLPESRQGEFVAAFKNTVAQHYPNLKESPDYCRIINDRHQQRIKHLLEDAIAKGARLEVGGETDDATRYFAPTILTNVSSDSELMQQEIFGPILPILTYQDVDQALRLINARPKPLALYIFSKSETFADRVLRNTSAGGTCINDVMVQFTNIELPYGGVNQSGVGNSHGYFGFKAFSHERAVLKQPGFSAMKYLYPPYTPKVRRLADFVLKYFT
ncbi:MAG TPA: aldehyde dehydrogenase family protein [Acidobacteriota bacterium]|nr:aldehyde dehydrogenase family protein [Acidobacteriota bacterium]